MSVKINKIHIRNFRSIKNISIDTDALIVLVGKNDSGKSNLLRALNLFFNGEVNPGEKFNFIDDHNIHNNPNKKAKEVVIKLELNIPNSYKNTNGDVIVWEKIWRESGLIKDKYTGYRETKNRLKNTVRKQVEIPTTSRLHSLLRKIEYRYVPAIKDALYFDSLRGEIYRTISEVANESFKKSSLSFEGSIGKHLKGLTEDILKSLDIDTRMAFPRDLTHIFERLDFLGGKKPISLRNRGDGIKARHIPLILKFIADKKRAVNVKGAAPTSFIWGYEEPENNIEITNCLALADEFWSFIHEDIAQIILTTHSPVFYNLNEKNTKDELYASCHHIYLDSPESGTEITHDSDELDQHMGTMSLLAPKILTLQKEIREQEDAKQIAEKLASDSRAKIFVEGPSDQLIIKKSIAVFCPGYSNRIDIETKDGGAGHGYVYDMLSAWHAVRTHNHEKPMAAGLVDGDASGSEAAKRWNSNSSHIKSCKCFKLEAPPILHGAFAKRFKIPITLEALYPKEIWDWALNNRHLKERNFTDIIPANLVNDILLKKQELSDVIDEGWGIYAQYDFKSEKKIAVAEYLSQKDNDEYKLLMKDFESITNKIVQFLFKNER